MPLQRVVEPHPLADQVLAVIDQQPQVELGPIQPRGGQRVKALSEGRPGDRDRVDAVGLPALATPLAGRGHQLGRDAHDALPARQQEPLKGARHVPAVLKRPHPFTPQATRPDHQAAEPASTDRDRLLAEHLARRRTDRGDRVRALVGVRTQHDH